MLITTASMISERLLLAAVFVVVAVQAARQVPAEQVVLVNHLNRIAIRFPIR
jgi:hypothetical protein